MKTPPWLITDIRSGIVSTIIATILAPPIAWGISSLVAKDVAEDVAKNVAEDVVAREKKMVVIRLNDQGHGYPDILFEAAEKEGYRIIFQPKELEKVAVCEYYPARGVTFADLALSYLAKYAACFNMKRTDMKTYEITPNKRSGALIQKNGKYFCKC